MKNNLVVIAGHGAADSGTARGSLVERELNIDTVLGMNDYISRTYKLPKPFTIITDPKAAAPLGEELLAQRIQRVNAEFGTDVLILDIHHNAEAAGTGAQVWYSQNAASTPGDDTQVIAGLVQEELGKLVREVVPLIRSDRSRFGGLGILDNTQGTAILVEMREIISDLADPISPAIVYAGGVAIATALSRYFNWPLLAPATEKLTDEQIAQGLDYFAEQLRERR